MNLQQTIFKKVYKNENERTILAHTPFGDILFKENEAYKALQIYVPNNVYGKDNPFLFVTHTIGNNESEYTNFIKQGDFFKEPHLPELYHKLFFREELYENISKENRKSNYQVYIADKTLTENTDLTAIEKVAFNDFCELALEFGKFD